MQYNLIIINNYWPSGTTPIIATYLHDFIFAFIGIFHSAVSLHSCAQMPCLQHLQALKELYINEHPDLEIAPRLIATEVDTYSKVWHSQALFTLSIGNHHIRPHNTRIERCKVCGWTLQKRVTEHKYAVRRADNNNDIAVHAHRHNHRIGWDNASTVSLQPYYWKMRVQEAITSVSTTILLEDEGAGGHH